MATSKNLERVCAIVLIVSLLASAGLVYVKANSGESTGQTMGYESRLFNTSRVHTIDIVMDDWDSFLENWASGRRATRRCRASGRSAARATASRWNLTTMTTRRPIMDSTS